MKKKLTHKSKLVTKLFTLIVVMVMVTLLLTSKVSIAAHTANLEFETLTLSNGLQVIVVPNHRAPVIYHSLWYKVGSADSPYERSGIAHFLEHLMYKGTSKFPGDLYKKTINRLGGTQNANTSWDRTVYLVTIAKEYLPQIMELEADRMQNLTFPEAELAKERTVVLQERNQRIDSSPEGRLMEATNANFFWHHPYGKPIIGFKHHIEQYTRDDVLKFYQQWYAPNNAVLVIAGDTTLAEIKPLLNKYYGGLKTKAIPERIRPLEPDHSNITAQVSIRDPQLKSMFLERCYIAPNHRTSSVAQEATITILAHLLGNNTTGRLHKALVEQQKIAHSSNASYNGYMLDPYSFSISATPVNAMDFGQVEAAIEAEIKRFVATGATEAELALAKKEYVLQYRYQHDSLSDIADFIGENLSHGYTLDEIKNWLTIMETVTVADLNLAAQKILTKPAAIAYAYPIIEN